MAVNSTWVLAPWADVLYGCDRVWWECALPGYGVEAREKFAGLKVAGTYVEGCHKIGVRVVSSMIWTGVEIGGGGNSAFQSINLAVLWGADRVILTGVDCKNRGQHWHGKHPSPMTTPEERAVAQWIKCFNQVAPALKKGGVEVINASRDTALECFPRMTIEEALGDDRMG